MPAAKRRLRVVYLDHVAQLSGGEIALLRVLPHLNDVEPHVVLAEDGPFADELVKMGISTEVLRMHESARGLRKESVTARTMSPMAVVGTALYTVRLAAYLRKLRPDLVHTNSLKAGMYGSCAARLVGVPAVWHVRDRITSDYLPRPAVWLVRLMTRKLPATVIANSQATLGTLSPRRDAEAARSVVPTVVPETIAPPSVWKDRVDGPFRIGMVGRLAPWKGQDLFLRAFAGAFPDTDTRCVIVGAALFGEHEFERDLQRLATELGINERVEFRGFCTDVWSQLARMDLLVHASRIPEPFGQVILEGMAAGVPVIVAAAGGPAELIRHDVDGMLFPMGDQQALESTMRMLASDPVRRSRLAEAALSRVAAFSPANVAPLMEAAYHQALTAPPRKSFRTRLSREPLRPDPS